MQEGAAARSRAGSCRPLTSCTCNGTGGRHLRPQDANANWRPPHDIEQQTLRNQAQPLVRRDPLVPARANRNGPRRARRRHRRLRGSFRRRLAVPRGFAHGAALDSRAFPALRRLRRRVPRSGNRAQLPHPRDDEPDHRRRRRRRRVAYRREEHVRQRDRPHQGGPRPGGAAGGPRRRPLGHLSDRQGVRGRGAAARHPLRRPHRLRAVHPRLALHQHPHVPPRRSDAARAEPRPGRDPQSPERRVGDPGLDRRRQPGDDDGRVSRRGPDGARRASPRWCRAMRAPT